MGELVDLEDHRSRRIAEMLDPCAECESTEPLSSQEQAGLLYVLGCVESGEMTAVEAFAVLMSDARAKEPAE